MKITSNHFYDYIQAIVFFLSVFVNYIYFLKKGPFSIGFRVRLEKQSKPEFTLNFAHYEEFNVKRLHGALKITLFFTHYAIFDVKTTSVPIFPPNSRGAGILRGFSNIKANFSR